MLAQQKAIHENALNHGFWDRNGVAQDPFDPGVVAEKLALIHSEVSEALEAVRHGNPPSDHVPEMDGFSEELADTVIRILDLAEARGIDLRNAILTKHSFNLSRSAMHGGKLI
jgi:NTP pyrophosphatase (non-canonical NTP hydrolase)